MLNQIKNYINPNSGAASADRSSISSMYETLAWSTWIPDDSNLAKEHIE